MSIWARYSSASRPYLTFVFAKVGQTTIPSPLAARKDLPINYGKSVTITELNHEVNLRDQYQEDWQLLTGKSATGDLSVTSASVADALQRYEAKCVHVATLENALQYLDTGRKRCRTLNVNPKP